MLGVYGLEFFGRIKLRVFIKIMGVPFKCYFRYNGRPQSAVGYIFPIIVSEPSVPLHILSSVLYDLTPYSFLYFTQNQGLPSVEISFSSIGQF